MGKSKHKDAIKTLISLGYELLIDIKAVHSERLERSAAAANLGEFFQQNYQHWYSESLAVIKQLLPDRLDEFISFYKNDRKPKTVGFDTFTIQDWVSGLRAKPDIFTSAPVFQDSRAVTMRLYNQIQLLEASFLRLDSSLYDIAKLVAADLFDSEIETATELMKHKFLRPAGVVAGVVLERHLRQVLDDRAIKIKKKKPTLSDLNDELKQNSIIDVPTWRKNQQLADIRNLCCHNDTKEPTSEQVEELIEGVSKAIKSIF